MILFNSYCPLRIALDEESFGNSYYEVIVKNVTKKEIFKYEVSPELLFTHYQLLEYYKNGKKVDEKYYPEEKSFIIDSKYINENNLRRLEDILDKESIGILLGWNYKFLNIAKHVNCYLVKIDGINLIIPHYNVFTAHNKTNLIFIICKKRGKKKINF